eukprot:m.818803 g.818803  ORF g.818803 m.818803 type:complete len:87 (+) comp59388_c0_seq126:3602-3862(+)
MCVDYRKLNAVTVSDSYPVPRIDDILDSLYGAMIFSSLDSASADHQVPVLEADVEQTALITHEGLHEEVVVPFEASKRTVVVPACD